MMLGRTVLLTVLFAALGMALGLMVGIFATIIGAAVHGASPDMRNAYLRFAIPTAITTGTCALLWNLFTGIRRLVRSWAVPKYLPQAPRGMFRVILAETGDELLIGDFDSYREACLAAARKVETPENLLRIYDDAGNQLGQLGR
jgi:hypothetical protein